MSSTLIYISPPPHGGFIASDACLLLWSRPSKPVTKTPNRVWRFDGPDGHYLVTADHTVAAGLTGLGSDMVYVSALNTAPQRVGEQFMRPALQQIMVSAVMYSELDEEQAAWFRSRRDALAAKQAVAARLRAAQGAK